MNFFGYRLIDNETYEKHTSDLLERMRLGIENEKLLSENLKLHSEIRAVRGTRDVIETDLGDPSPVDRIERAAYVARVAGVYVDILKPKLKQMISATHSIMETPNSDLDAYLKGVAYALREMMKWGESMINEQLANQKGENPSSSSDNNL